MGVLDDVLGWLRPALQELKAATDQPWADRRAKFVEQLGLSDAEQHPVVAELTRRLDELPEDERTTLLSSDRLDATATEVATALVTEPERPREPGEGYDEQAWHTFLTTNGPSWDGTADSWQAFRQWFEYHAADQRLSGPATALLDALDAQPVSQRVATFATYGVTIAAPAQASGSTDGGFLWVTDDQVTALTTIFGPDWQAALNSQLPGRWGADWQTHPAEHKSVWLGDLIKSGEIGAVPEEVLAELRTLIDSIPGASQLSEDELFKVLQETIHQAGS